MVYNTAILQGTYVKGFFTTTSRRRNQDTGVTCTCRRVDTRHQLVVWLVCKKKNIPICLFIV